MNIFLGLIKSDNIGYFRILSTSENIIKDIPEPVLINNLAKNAIGIRNLSLDKNYKIVGTCGNIKNYGFIDYDSGNKKNVFVILMRHGDSYLVTDIDGKAYIFSKLEAIVISQTAGIANAKIVTRNGETYISAISGTFDTGRSAADKMSEQIGKYAKLDSEGKLGKRMQDHLNKAEKAFEEREQGIREAESKRLLGIGDQLFMQPVTSHLNRLEQTKDKAPLERSVKKIKKIQDNIAGSLKLLAKKKTYNADALKTLNTRKDLYNDAVKELLFHYGDETIPDAEMQRKLRKLEERGSILYQDIVNFYSEGVLTANAN